MQQSATSHPALATSRCLVCNGVLGPHPRLPGLRECSGCGFFLDEVRSSYEHVGGVDISEASAEYARTQLGVEVVAADYLARQLPEQVEALCMWDTVEHLRRPRDFIEKAARDVRPGGLLALTTGDIDSLNARLRGRRWRMIHLPTHLHYFSRRTLVRLLDSAGFDVVHLETAGNKRSIRGIVDAILVLRGGRQGLFDKVKSLPGLGRSITLDLRDIVYLIASPLVSSSALTPVELSSLHLDQVLGPPKVRR